MTARRALSALLIGTAVMAVVDGVMAMSPEGLRELWKWAVTMGLAFLIMAGVFWTFWGVGNALGHESERQHWVLQGPLVWLWKGVIEPWLKQDDKDEPDAF